MIPGLSTRLCCIRFTLSFKTEKDVEAKADTTKLITCLNAGRKSEEETHIYFPCKKQSTLSVCSRVLKSKRCPSDTKSNKWQNTAEKKTWFISWIPTKMHSTIVCKKKTDRYKLPFLRCDGNVINTFPSKSNSIKRSCCFNWPGQIQLEVSANR